MKTKRLRLTMFLCILCTFVMTFSQKDVLLHIMGMEATAQDDTADTVPIIVIDAGHGGYDTGSVAQNGVYEKDVTLSLALKTGAMLEEEGYQVCYTRTSDEVSWNADNREDLATRVAIGKEVNADYYISIHVNSSDYNDGASGFEIYLDGSDETILEIASRLESSLISLQYTQDRGIKTTEESPLYVIDQNEVPAMLVEFGFLSDDDDAQYLCSEEGQNQLAQCLKESIVKNITR